MTVLEETSITQLKPREKNLTTVLKIKVSVKQKEGRCKDINQALQVCGMHSSSTAKRHVLSPYMIRNLRFASSVRTRHAA